MARRAARTVTPTPVDMFVERFAVKQSPWYSKIMADKLVALGDRFTRNQELVPRTDP